MWRIMMTVAIVSGSAETLAAQAWPIGGGEIRMVPPALSMSTDTLTAQAGPVRKGDRVRMPGRAEALELGARPGWLTASAHQGSQRFGRAGSFLIEADFSAVQARSRSHGSLRGAGKGLLIGAAAGGLLGLLYGDDDEGLVRFTAEQKAVMFGVTFGVTGAVVGAVMGARSPGRVGPSKK